MAEYCFQAFLIIIISIVTLGFKRKYLFSFITALIYGNILDLLMKIIDLIPQYGSIQRILFFVLGLLVCAMGVSLLFHTYIPPEAYELFVKEISDKTGTKIYIVKTIYDCVSCFIAVIMSFCFFGFCEFEGVKIGTIVCALVNGWCIGKFSSFFEKNYIFKDAFRK